MVKNSRHRNILKIDSTFTCSWDTPELPHIYSEANWVLFTILVSLYKSSAQMPFKEEMAYSLPLLPSVFPPPTQRYFPSCWIPSATHPLIPWGAQIPFSPVPHHHHHNWAVCHTEMEKALLSLVLCATTWYPKRNVYALRLPSSF